MSTITVIECYVICHYKSYTFFFVLSFCYLYQFTFFASSDATDYHFIISQDIFKILNG